MKVRVFGTLIAVGLLAAAVVPSTAAAATWMLNQTVTKLSTYPANSWHFVWLSGGVPASCTYSPNTLGYDEAGAAGKSATALLMAALLSGKTVDVQVDGCTIIEVYLHN